MKARKMVATAVVGLSVFGGASGAGAQTSVVDDTVRSISNTLNGTLAGLGLSVPSAPALPSAPSVPALPQAPDTSGIQVTAGSIKVSVGGHSTQVDVPQAPATPSLPATPALPAAPAMPAVPSVPSVDVPQTDAALLRIWIFRAADEVRAMSTSMTSDGHQDATTTTASGVKMFAAGLEVAGLGPISLAVTQAWATASTVEQSQYAAAQAKVAEVERELSQYLP